MKSLRFAVLFDGKSLEAWHLQCLKHLEIIAALSGVIPVRESGEGRGRTASSLLRRLFVESAGDAGSAEIAGRLQGVQGYRDLESITCANLDFVLKLGSASVPSGIERTTRHGVWLFEHERNGDPLPFLREVDEAEDVTETALLALRSVGGETQTAILERGSFRTEKGSYIANRKRVLEEIAQWPALVCRRLIDHSDLHQVLRPGAAIAQPAASDRLPRLIHLCASMIRGRLHLAWERLFRHEQWNIGVLRVPVGTLLRPGAYVDSNIEWFPLDGKEGFLADPFGIMRGNTLYVLCEYFDYRKARGHICTLQASDYHFAQRPQPAIILPAHMSYPCLIEEAGEIYCVPETCQSHEVALFRAIHFPHKWTKVAVLVDQFAGVDPTIFRHDGRWWLMCTHGGRNADVKLFVWHAASLFGPWTAHAQNPVKIDVRGARPGGMPFVHEGVLYRPTQDCSKRYGWRIAIQRVMRLTPTEFVEEPVVLLGPSAGSPFPMGRHTLTPVGDFVLIDGRRAVFVWSAFWWFLSIWWSDTWARLRR